MLKGTIIVGINLSSIVSFAMQRNGNKTAIEYVNEVLSRSPEIYNFDAKDFEGEKAADARITEFQERKKAIVEKLVTKGIQERIDTIIDANTFSLGGYSINRFTVTGLANVALPVIGSYAVSSMIPPLTAITGEVLKLHQYSTAREECRQQVNTAIGFAQWGIDNRCSAPSYQTVVDDLSSLKKDILDALLNDPLRELEEKVVRAWHEFDQPGMRKTLINTLLDLRITSGKSCTELRDKIEYCLKLPKKSKQLVPGSKINNEVDKATNIAEFKKKRSAFINDNFSKEPWCNYSTDTQENLKSTFTQVCNGPCKTSLGFKDRRKIIFFHGEPATGKTEASKALVKMLGLPKVELGSSSGDQVTQKTLTGNSSYPSEIKLGLLFQPLFAADDGGQNWNNAVVVIEEFDRHFKKDGIDPFILWLFDPTTTIVKCDYFGKDVYVDVSKLTFVLTSNTDLGLDAYKELIKKYPKIEDPFKALRDRLIFIHFDKFRNSYSRQAPAKTRQGAWVIGVFGLPYN